DAEVVPLHPGVARCGRADPRESRDQWRVARGAAIHTPKHPGHLPVDTTKKRGICGEREQLAHVSPTGVRVDQVPADIDASADAGVNGDAAHVTEAVRVLGRGASVRQA